MRQIETETEDETLGETYVYRGFVVNWRVGRLACLRPGESEITPEMRDRFWDTLAAKGATCPE